MRLKMRALKFENIIVTVIVTCIIPYCCATNHSELETEYSTIVEEPKEECPEYGAITNIVTFLSNHLITVINGNDSVFFSPFGISISIAMLYLGAGGETANDIEISLGYRKLNLSNPSEDIHRIFQNTLESMELTSDSYHLEVANGMFMQSGLDISPNYIQDLKRYYFTDIHSADFMSDNDLAISQINTWVSNKTSNTITSLFNEPLDPVTVLILANAIYFKGIWKLPFNPRITKTESFYISKNMVKQVPFMESKNTVLYFRDNVTNYKFLELDYKGGELSMIFALPVNKSEFPKLELSTSLMCRVRKNFAPVKTHVMIPRFRLSYERELSEDLFHLGLGDLFSKERANLTGIRPQNDLFVSAMIHKAKIDVNEEGSEASAATGSAVNARSGLTRYNIFKANHPFLFSIVDKRTGTLLFLGRVVDF